MNCRRVEKMIPLYVGGDLASGLADRLTSHLEWCSRCNWLADEYKESQSWLRSAETPAFDEPFFADLKRDVLRRVSITNARPSLIASLAQRWNRRQVLALCASTMIIFGVLMLYLYQTRTHSGGEHSELKQAQNSDTASRPADSNAVTEAASGTSSGNSAGSDSSMKGHPGPKRHRSAKRDISGLLSRLTPQPSPGDKTADNTAESAGSIPDVSFDSHDMLKIEIQTSDPNIRIIWFAPKETESHQTKPATD